MSRIVHCRALRPTAGASGLMRSALLLLSLAGLVTCSGVSLKENLERDPPTYAPAPANEGPLANIAHGISAEYGADYSGFSLLDASYDSLAWRLALVDSAVSSIDMQTYLWSPDSAGLLMLDRLIRAANRGVQVRLLVDDLLTINQDQVLYELQQSRNIEFRVFNPWRDRGLVSRGTGFLTEMDRLNTRMHDKLLVVDGRAAIVGGRNTADHYFGLSADYNFHDLDLLGFGDIAVQCTAMFDHFWNSNWVVSASNFDLERDPEFARETLTQIRSRINAASALDAFPRLPRDWTMELAEIEKTLHPGTSKLVYDATQKTAIAQNVAASMFPTMILAQRELLITNAYVIPGQPAVDFMQSLSDRGVDVRILTNSLSSHDVPAVNSHYKGWRDDLIGAGVELFELRADADITSLVEVPPNNGEFIGLHTKSFVVDRELLFIGSMNLDPRSASINTEAGVFVRSESLAADLAGVMLRDMSPENAWQVKLDADGEVYWVNSDERVDRQPARNFWQRIMDVFFMMFPKEQY